jgi:hypothetical protein
MELKDQIQAEIAKTNDQSMRTMLLLMLGVLESTAEGIRGLGSKLDNIYSDEHELRARVLNGHYEEFDDNMRWVKERRADSAMDVATRHFVAERLANGGMCEFAKRKIADEQEALVDAKATKRKIMDVFIEKVLGQIITGLTSAAAVVAALLFVPK